MKATEDLKSISSNIQSGSQETPLSLQDALTLLGLKEVPDLPWGKTGTGSMILDSTKKLMSEHEYKSPGWLCAKNILVKHIEMLAEF
jgi:hypothetical protein